ncbi:MAG: hypothetical protein JWM98_2335 [Thermoleophilia bacterium]|nr:hypothetical protein [Thermoleophilia bacterium]
MGFCRSIAKLFGPSRRAQLEDVDAAGDDPATITAWARELGVTPEVMGRMVSERGALVAQVAVDPRAWGFDLLPAGAPRRDVSDEYRARTRLTGAISESFLAGHAPLLAMVPDPPTLPDGTPLDVQLLQEARLEPDVVHDLTQHLRTTIQARLGRPLDAEAVEHAVRDVAWDHDLDVANTLPRVLAALARVL